MTLNPVLDGVNAPVTPTVRVLAKIYQLSKTLDIIRLGLEGNPPLIPFGEVERLMHPSEEIGYPIINGRMLERYGFTLPPDAKPVLYQVGPDGRETTPFYLKELMFNKDGAPQTVSYRR